VFETTNTTLKQQLEALQRQLTSPEATTPSFVAKQRQQLAAAANAQAGLQSENMKLRQELLELRLALEARGGDNRRPSRDGGRGSAAAGEEDALAEAERLLSDGADEGPGGRSDWKVQEIERLQAENRQLQDKVRWCF
jgi:cell division septum initiation protein DivIVA